MFSHVMVGTNNIEESKIFYDKLLGALGSEPGVLSLNSTGQKRYFYFLDHSTFCIGEPIDGNPATLANGGTIGFKVKDEEQGKAWHDVGVANGGTSIEDPPGIREYDGIKMFLAYLRDPSGNKLCGLLRIE